MIVIYAAILVINIGYSQLRIPMPSMAYCQKTVELEVDHNYAYSSQMHCEVLPDAN